MYAAIEIMPRNPTKISLIYDFRSRMYLEWFKITQDQDFYQKCQIYTVLMVLTWATVDLMARWAPKSLQRCEHNRNIQIDKLLSSQCKPDAPHYFYMNGLFDMLCCWHCADNGKYFFVRLKWNHHILESNFIY